MCAETPQKPCASTQFRQKPKLMPYQICRHPTKQHFVSSLQQPLGVSFFTLNKSASCFRAVH